MPTACPRCGCHLPNVSGIIRQGKCIHCWVNEATDLKSKNRSLRELGKITAHALEVRKVTEQWPALEAIIVQWTLALKLEEDNE